MIFETLSFTCFIIYASVTFKTFMSEVSKGKKISYVHIICATIMNWEHLGFSKMEITSIKREGYIPIHLGLFVANEKKCILQLSDSKTFVKNQNW